MNAINLIDLCITESIKLKNKHFLKEDSTERQSTHQQEKSLDFDNKSDLKPEENETEIQFLKEKIEHQNFQIGGMEKLIKKLEFENQAVH